MVLDVGCEAVVRVSPHHVRSPFLVVEGKEAAPLGIVLADFRAGRAPTGALSIDG